MIPLSTEAIVFFPHTLSFIVKLKERYTNTKLNAHLEAFICYRALLNNNVLSTHLLNEGTLMIQCICFLK